jgi:hypothetical protein
MLERFPSGRPLVAGAAWKRKQDAGYQGITKGIPKDNEGSEAILEHESRGFFASPAQQ